MGALPNPLCLAHHAHPHVCAETGRGTRGMGRASMRRARLWAVAGPTPEYYGLPSRTSHIEESAVEFVAWISPWRARGGGSKPRALSHTYSINNPFSRDSSSCLPVSFHQLAESILQFISIESRQVPMLYNFNFSLPSSFLTSAVSHSHFQFPWTCISAYSLLLHSHISAA